MAGRLGGQAGVTGLGEQEDWKEGEEEGGRTERERKKMLKTTTQRAKRKMLVERECVMWGGAELLRGRSFKEQGDRLEGGDVTLWGRGGMRQSSARRKRGWPGGEGGR